MSRIETIGAATLYLGDCRDVLPTIGAVDAVVTDIPYEISGGTLEGGGWVGRKTSGGLRDLNYGGWDGEGSTGDALEALAMCARVPTVVAFCDWRQIASVPTVLPLRSERIITWVKSNPPILNGQHLFLSSVELAYYGKLAGAWFGGHCTKAVWTGTAPTGDEREHRTQKPVDLMKWVLGNVCAPNATALDMFMGSGTTGVAAVKMGRKFIGIERDEGYFDIACKRIEQAQRQADMFIGSAA